MVVLDSTMYLLLVSCELSFGCARFFSSVVMDGFFLKFYFSTVRVAILFIFCFLGFGNGIICISVFVFMYGIIEVVGLINFVFIVFSSLLFYMFCKYVNWCDVRFFLSMGIIGVFIGVQLFASLDGSIMIVGLGVIIIGILVRNLCTLVLFV